MVFALIGCGAVAERFYLSSLHGRVEPEEIVFVDHDVYQREKLASAFGGGRTAEDHTRIEEELDGAIIATPPATHHPIAMDLLERGVPLLIEKPVTVDVDHARNIVEISREQGVPVCTNYTRRLFPNVRRVQALLEEGRLGSLESIHVEEGSDFDWPTTSGFYFDRSRTPKGVLLDRGPHILGVLDLWLDGDYRVSSFHDDSSGGTEAVAELQLEHETGTDISIRLSWLNRLENRYRLEGSRGTVECEIHDWRNLSIKLDEESGLTVGDDVHGFEAFMDRTVGNFFDVIRKEASPITPAKHVLPSVEAIAQAYQRRERFDMPWLIPRWSA